MIGDSPIRARPNEWLEQVSFQMTCERGKENLGLGNNSVGELVPGILGRLGLCAIRVWMSDKCSVLVPPYDDVEQRTNVSQLKDWSERGVWIWDEDETRRYFLAGGGAPDAFDRLWALATNAARETVRAQDERRYDAAGGSVMYIIDARKPASVAA
jgi:hypothetical protein